jgi:hypothetical protein
MTEQEIAGLGPAFATYLGRYRSCFLQKRTAAHFDTYCRGLLSDLPRKSVEPIALEAGTAVRTLQEFLVSARWDHEHARDLLQRHLAEEVATLPADPLGTVGVIDETSCQKWGAQTPGVQRQYLGCLGKIDNGIVTVHVGVAKGCFHALLDADLYLPEAWDTDRPCCRAAGIRTPLLVAWPGRVHEGTTSDAMVSWLDLLPTCLEAAGGTPPRGISGRSFLAVLRGLKATHRDQVFATQRRRPDEPLSDSGGADARLEIHPQPRPGRRASYSHR